MKELLSLWAWVVPPGPQHPRSLPKRGPAAVVSAPSAATTVLVVVTEATARLAPPAATPTRTIGLHHDTSLEATPEMAVSLAVRLHDATITTKSAAEPQVVKKVVKARRRKAVPLLNPRPISVPPPKTNAAPAK